MIDKKIEVDSLSSAQFKHFKPVDFRRIQKEFELLQEHRYYGLSPSQVSCLQQAKVAAFADASGALAHGKTPYELSTKPHGHGDVHSLLHTSGLEEFDLPSPSLARGTGHSAAHDEVESLVQEPAAQLRARAEAEARPRSMSCVPQGG